MRLAQAQTMQQDVAARLPDARVTRIYDGRRGYALVVENGGKYPATIRTKTDARRVLPKVKAR